MDSISGFCDCKLYRQHSGNWDNQLFRERILSCLNGRSATLLDFGAGRGYVKEMDFRGIAAKACGVDVDPGVLQNPYLDEAHIIGTRIPYPDGSFDMVVCNNVLEHLADPVATFREIHRVLKPDGVFLVKTPNVWHYVPLIARITPVSFHRTVARWRGRMAEDTFPTFYRANSIRQLRTVCALATLHLADVVAIEGRPEYMRVSAATYLAGFIYERIVNASDLLAPFRVVLMATIAKDR